MYTAVLDPEATITDECISSEALMMKEYPKNILQAMEQMRQDVMRLSTPHTPTIAFRPNIDIKHLNVQDWPKYKSASAVLGHAFETYMSRMFNGRKF